MRLSSRGSDFFEHQRGFRPGFHDHFHQSAICQQLRDSLFNRFIHQTEIVCHPFKPGDSKRMDVCSTKVAHGLVQGGYIVVAPLFLHPFAQVIYALEFFTPRDHQLAGTEPELQGVLFEFPIPPGALFAILALEISGTYRAIPADVFEHFIGGILIALVPF